MDSIDEFIRGGWKTLILPNGKERIRKPKKVHKNYLNPAKDPEETEKRKKNYEI